MKIVFTEGEIKEIIIAHIRRTAGITMDDVQFHSYNYDFCVATQDEKKVEKVKAVKAIDDGDPFQDL